MRFVKLCATRALGGQPPSVFVRVAPGITGAMRVLVVTTEPVDVNRLRTVLDEQAEQAEVRVVSPALNESRLAFWMSDSDGAIADAQRVQRESMDELKRAGLSAEGEAGDS